MTKKNKVLMGILFGMPFGAIGGFWIGFTVHVWAGVLAGVTLFALGGWGMLQVTLRAAEKQRKRYVELREEIGEAEPLKRDGLANYERGGSLYQGRLFLTTKAFHFAGKTKGGEEKRFLLPLDGLALASRYQPSEYVKTGLQLRMKDGSVYKFVVEVPEEWIDAVTAPAPVQPDNDPNRKFPYGSLRP